MLGRLGVIARDKRMLSYVICLIAASSAAGSTMPYQAVLATQVLDLTNGQYSLMMIATAIITVAVSLSIGAASDALGGRRKIIVACSIAGIMAHTLVSMFFGTQTFIFAHTVLIPIAFTVFQQLFVLIRLGCADLPKAEAEGITSTTRAFIAFSYVVVPPIIGLIVVMGVSFNQVYALGVPLYAVCIALIMSTPEQTVSKPTEKAPTLAPGEKEPRLWLGVLAPLAFICLLEAARKLHGTIFPLVVLNDAGGSLSDVGILAGLIAAFEIPLIVFWSAQIGKYQKSTLIGVGGIIYGIYILIFSTVNSVSLIYWLLPLHVFGVSALMSINIAFLQELMPRRLGLSTSFVSVVGFVGGALASGAFALHEDNDSYASVAYWAAGFALIGGICVVIQKITWLRKAKPAGG